METLELIVKLFIQENGGADRLAYIIEAEWCKSFRITDGKQWTESESLRLLQLYPLHPTKYIAIKMHKSVSAVEKKIKRLRNKSVLEYKFAKFKV